MHMHAKCTVKGVRCIVQRLVVFSCDAAAWRCVDQDSRAFHNLRLIGMKNGNVVEVAIERPCTLTGHEGHVGMGGPKELGPGRRDRDADQDQCWEILRHLRPARAPRGAQVPNLIVR